MSSSPCMRSLCRSGTPRWFVPHRRGSGFRRGSQSTGLAVAPDRWQASSSGFLRCGFRSPPGRTCGHRNAANIWLHLKASGEVDEGAGCQIAGCSYRRDLFSTRNNRYNIEKLPTIRRWILNALREQSSLNFLHQWDYVCNPIDRSNCPVSGTSNVARMEDT